MKSIHRSKPINSVMPRCLAASLVPKLLCYFAIETSGLEQNTGDSYYIRPEAVGELLEYDGLLVVSQITALE
jgi:hypothetical protein